MSETAIARETPVTWKSKLGYTYEGTVVAGPDDRDTYEVMTSDGAKALVARDDLHIVGDEADPDPDLSPEQHESLRAERARQHANSRVTDAMQSVYALLREDLKRSMPGPEADIDVAVLDDLRIRAAELVLHESEALRDAIKRQVEAKRS